MVTISSTVSCQVNLPVLSLTTTLNSLLRLVIYLVLIGGQDIARAQNTSARPAFSTVISYCQDHGAKFSIQDAITCNYLPKNELPRKKFADAPTWVRINVSTLNKNAFPLAIRIGPHFLNQIDLYENIDDKWTKQSAGSVLPFDPLRASLGGYTFKVHTQAEDSKNYYLRIHTPGLNLARIDVSEWDLSGLEQLNQQIGMGIQIGALGLILTFSLISYLANPNVLMFRFFWLMLNLLLCTLAGSGILAKYFFAQLPWVDNTFFNSMLCLRMACWLWVSQAFFISYRTPRWYPLSCNLIYLLVLICTILIFFNEQFITPILMLVVMLSMPVIQIVAILQTPHLKRSFRITMLTGFLCADTLILLTLLFAVLPFGTESVSIYFARAVDFINPLVLLSIFAIRNKMMQKEFDEIKTNNIQINLRLEFERKLLNERRMLIDMLTHELKNPLASISMAVGSLALSVANKNVFEARRLQNIEKSIRSMDIVIERCSLMNQVDQKELSAKNESVVGYDFIQSLLKNIPEFSRIKLKLSPAVRFDTDTYFFQIVLTNLIENALKYSPAHSIVQIELFERKDYVNSKVCVEISNEVGAQGVPDFKVIFNRFYRNPLAMNTPGSGLGLYLVKEICTILGGTVKYISEPDTVKFVVELPSSQL